MAIIGAAYFFLDADGLTTLRTRRMLKKVRNRFDQAAAAAGAKTSARPHHGRGTMLLFYEYPDGNYLMLEVDARDFAVRTYEDKNPGSRQALHQLRNQITSIERRPIL
ncbi:hypothetical protein D3C86_1261050 [compost metagenome]